VANPHSERGKSTSTETEIITIPDTGNSVKTFFYPVVSRPFKNFETICEASKILQKRNITNYKILLTIDGTEENYSKYILKKYSLDNKINFMGRISLDEVHKLYGKTDCLLFPSKLETWGLPISEFAEYKKPMIISDLPYAHETASGARKTFYFNPDNAEELANIMEDVINNNLSKFHPTTKVAVNQPFTQGWDELIELIVKN
jgi:glycosyltransferase involved in cell wall biosynthesis